MSEPGTCTGCGQANPPGAKFCNECGAPLAHVAGQEVRKTLTVLFADLVGFTSLGERLDQESLRRVMDRFYEEMRGAVHAHGGTVAKFIGDAVMAVWGTPVVREDDALRAVRAAEEMRAALAALNLDLEQRWGVRVGMRTGVNTGEVVVDPTKPADLLVGDTLNVAARLEQAAPDGDVLVGPETYRLVRAGATLEPVEPLQLKGKSRRLPAYRLVDGTRPDRRGADRLTAPLVGRDAELERLRAAFDATIADGRAHLVTVIGSPGVGKSRLAQELTARLEDEARILRGHCAPATEGATFLPVAELLRDAGGLEAVAEDEPQVREAFEALLADGRPVAPEVTFWAVRRFLEGLAHERPVVVVLDDIHWGEPTFLDLLEHLAAWGRRAVLVVALARPELRDVRPGLVEDAIALEPLAPEASRALVDGLLGAADLPEPLAGRLLETADGNPLFLGEMLRMLVDDGVLRRDGDTWTVVATEQVSVPPTIQALLAARLERLPPAERTVAERAAVIGPQFSREAVAELAGSPLDATIDEHLDALRRKELISTLPGDEPAFRFGHALIRDAAYRPLLKQARAELHERLAVWLEERGDEQDEVVGFHLERAYGYRRELGPLDDHARGLGSRAGERLREAGRRALEREDLPAATNLLTRALDVLEPDDAARADALLDLAEALLSAGDTARGGEAVEELALRADAARDERLRALATVYGGQLANLVGAGAVRETIEVLDRAAATLAAAQDRRGEAKAHHVIAGAHALLGEVAAAEAALDRALVAARAAGDRRRVTAVLSGAPRAALWGPSPVVRASGRCLDVVRIVRMTPGNRHVETMALRCQAVLEAMRGRADAGRGILRDGRTALEELGLTLELQELDVYAGTVELLAGEPAAAEAHLRAARDGFLALGVDTGAAQASALLARAVLEQARDDEAIALTEFAEERGGEDLKTAIAWRGVRAEALARRGDHEAAEALARDAVALSEPTDALADKADAQMALADVLRAAGKAGEAVEAARRARDLYAAKEHQAGAARAAAMADAGGPPEREPAARDEPLTRSVPAREERAPSEARRVLAALLRCVNDQDWDGVRAIYEPGVRIVDRRPQGADMDVEQLIEGYRLAAERVPGVTWTRKRVVAMSDTAAASVAEFRGELKDGGPTAHEYGAVHVVRSGRIVRMEMFEPADEAGMLARFEELSREPAAAAPTTTARRLAAEYDGRYNARDWEGMRAMLADDLVHVDRRRVALWDIDGPDEVIAHLRESARGIADIRATSEVLAEGPWLLARRLSLDWTLDGGAMESTVVQVVVWRDGRLARIEHFDPDDESAVLTRFDELLVEHAPTPAERVGADFLRRFHAEDFDGLAELFAADFVQESHLRLSLWRYDTPAEFVQELRELRRMAPDIRGRIETLAADGDVVASRQVWSGSFEGGPMVIRGGLVALCRAGQVARLELFEPDDEAALLARFHELCDGGGTTSPGVRVAQEFLRRFNARDWDGMRELVSDDFVHEDRRGVRLWTAMDVEGWMETLREAARAMPDLQASMEIVAQRGSAMARRLRMAGTYGGAAVEFSMGQVVVFGDDGRFVRIEAVDDDDEEGLLARFAELSGQDTEPQRVLAELSGERENLAVTARARWVEAFEARDWDALHAVYADDAVSFDHRPFGFGRVQGVGPVVQLLRNAAEVGATTWVSRPAATHGRRLALFAEEPTGIAASGERTAAVPIWIVIQTDADGRIWSLDAYDEEGEADARGLFEELARFDASNAAHTAAAERRDWDAMRALLRPDGVVEYHPAGQTFTGREPMLAQLRAVIEPSASLQVAMDRLQALDGGVRRRRETWRGHDRAGSTWDAVLDSVLVLDAQGRIYRCETFLPGDPRIDEAVARLAGGATEPAVVQTRRRFCAAFEARDWEAVRDLHAEDTIVVDHRPTGFGEVRGADDMLALRRNVAGVGATHWRSRPVAVHGERLALVAETVGNDDPPIAVDTLSVVQVDTDGRLWRTDVFTPEQEADARDLLDRLAAFHATNEERTRLFERKDWGALAGHVAPDAVMEYGPLEQRFEGRDAILAQWRAAFDPTDVTCVADRLEVPAPYLRIARERWSGTYEGAAWEAEQQVVARLDDAERVLHVAMFEVGDPRFEEAVARLSAENANAATAAHPSGTPLAIHGDRLALIADGGAFVLVQVDRDGAVWQADRLDDEAAARERFERVARFAELGAAQLHALPAGEWEAMRASVAPDVVMEYRPTESRFAGGDELVAHWRSVHEGAERLEGDFDRFDEPRPNVFTRRETWSGTVRGTDWEIAHECVCVLDGEGRMTLIEQLTAGDPQRDEAVERLAAAATPR